MFVWIVKVKCMFVWSWMQLLEFCWVPVHVKLNTFAWMKLIMRFDVFYIVIWVAKYSILSMQLCWMKFNATSTIWEIVNVWFLSCVYAWKVWECVLCLPPICIFPFAKVIIQGNWLIMPSMFLMTSMILTC